MADQHPRVTDEVKNIDTEPSNAFSIFLVLPVVVETKQQGDHCSDGDHCAPGCDDSACTTDGCSGCSSCGGSSCGGSSCGGGSG